MAGFIDRIREGAEKAAFEADRLRRLTQAQGELRAIIRKLEASTAELGKHALALHDAGTLGQPELEADCVAIDAVRQAIEDKEQEIQRIREEKPPETHRPTAYGHICPQCQIELPLDAMFCHHCGTRSVDIAPPAPPDAEVCPSCGAGLQPGVAFCPGCGARVEPLKVIAGPTCPHCGISIPLEASFCPECGRSTVPRPPGVEATPEAAEPVLETPVATEEPRCPQCGTAIAEAAVFCPECGHSLGPEPTDEQVHLVEAPTVVIGLEQAGTAAVPTSEAEFACPTCGASIPKEAVFCPECGGSIDQVPVQLAREVEPIEDRLPLDAPTVLVGPGAGEPVPALACPACGASIPEEAVFCPECGGSIDQTPVLPTREVEPIEDRLPPDAPTVLVGPGAGEPVPGLACPACGAGIPDEAVFCPECGEFVEHVPVETAPEEELVSAEVSPDAPTVLVEPSDIQPAAAPVQEPDLAQPVAGDRTCKHCGASAVDEAVFCPECGQLVETGPDQLEESAPEPLAEEALPRQPEPELTVGEPTPAEMPLAAGVCANCGTAVPAEAVFCPDCGELMKTGPDQLEESAPGPLAEEAPPRKPEPELTVAEPTPAEVPLAAGVCSNCGTVLPAGAVFCPDCGELTRQELHEEEARPPELPAQLAGAPQPEPEFTVSEPTPAEMPLVTGVCPNCGSAVPAEAISCPDCGELTSGEPDEEEEQPPETPATLVEPPSPVEPEPTPGELPRVARICPGCGAVVPEQAIFCPECGQSTAQEPPAQDHPGPVTPTVIVERPGRDPGAEPEPPQQPGDGRVCPQCGASIPEEAVFCPECGGFTSAVPAAFPSAESAEDEHGWLEVPTVLVEPDEAAPSPAPKPGQQAEPAPPLVAPAAHTCSQCRAAIPEEAVFCPECGHFIMREAEPLRGERSHEEALRTERPAAASIRVAERACPHCGAPVPPEAVFCPECGEPTTAVPPAGTPGHNADVSWPPAGETEDEAIPLAGDTLQLIRCPACRAGIAAESQTCPECGHALHGTPRPQPLAGVPEATAVVPQESAGASAEAEEALGASSATVVAEQEHEGPSAEEEQVASTCPYCLGLIVDPSAEICPHCRQPLLEQEATEAQAVSERPPQSDLADAHPEPPSAPQSKPRPSVRTCPFCLGLARAGDTVCPTCRQPLEEPSPTGSEPRRPPSAPSATATGSEHASFGSPTDDTQRMKICPTCRAGIPAMAAFCPECGASID